MADRETIVETGDGGAAGIVAGLIVVASSAAAAGDGSPPRLARYAPPAPALMHTAASTPAAALLISIGLNAPRLPERARLVPGRAEKSGRNRAPFASILAPTFTDLSSAQVSSGHCSGL